MRSRRIYRHTSAYGYIKIKALAARQQDACVTGDSGQRGTQIVGNGTQEICSEFFVSCLQLGYFHFLRISVAFQSQGTLALDGQQYTVFKGFQRFAPSTTTVPYTLDCAMMGYCSLFSFVPATTPDITVASRFSSLETCILPVWRMSSSAR